jgi:hypothetical protein
MRIYTVTCNGMPAAVVRADNPSDAVDIAQAMGGLGGTLAAREPDDGEMVSWLEHRSDHLLPAFVPMAIAS